MPAKKESVAVEANVAPSAQWLALSAKDRLDLTLALMGLAGDFGGRFGSRPDKSPQIKPSKMESALIEWRDSGQALPPSAKEWIDRGRIKARQESVSAVALRLFAQEGTAHSALLRRAGPLLLSGRADVGEIRDEIIERFAKEERLARKEALQVANNSAEMWRKEIADMEAAHAAAPRGQGGPREAEYLAERKKEIGKRISPKGLERTAIDAAKESLVHRREAIKGAVTEIQANAIGALGVMARALEDEQVARESAGWPLLGGQKKMEKTAAGLAIRGRKIPAGEDEGGAMPLGRAIEALQADGDNSPIVLDAELGQWLIGQARAQKRFSAFACGELLRLAMSSPDLMDAFLPHVGERLLAPLTSADEPWSMEREFPGWKPERTQAALGRLEAAALDEEAVRRARVAEEAAREGAMGKLAAAAAEIYGFTAENGQGLVGEAKKTLIQEAGWTQGVWRLAANNPEFAQLCAKSLAEQAKEARQALSGHDAAKKKRDRQAVVERAAASVGLEDEEAAQRIERRKQEATRLSRWLVEKKAQARASVRARALMSVGQAALVRGGLGEEFLDFTRLLSMKPRNWEESKILWARALLAGAAAKLQERSEAAIRQTMNDQAASQALAEQWAVALAEGWSRTKVEAEKDNQGRDKSEREIRDRAIADYMEALGELQDCVLSTPGFMLALPKKFGWGFLMNAQERWHEEQRDREFSSSRSATVKWAVAMEPFAEGELSAEPLADARALFDEGKAMKHCVFSYADRCEAGGTRIVSIRKNGERVSTLELFPLDASKRQMNVKADGSNAGDVAGWSQGQNNGPCNSRIEDPAVLAFCERYKAFLGDQIKDAKARAKRAAQPRAEEPKRLSAKPGEDKSASAEPAKTKRLAR
jgi:hypothetical protein